MRPDTDLMPDPERLTEGRDSRRFSRAVRAQPVIHRHRLDPEARPQTQMQKGGGIPTARKRHSDCLVRWQPVPDQRDQPILYWHPNPCIATVAWVVAMLVGNRVPTSASVTQASDTWPKAPNPSPSFNSASGASGPSGAAENASR